MPTGLGQRLFRGQRVVLLDGSLNTDFVGFSHCEWVTHFNVFTHSPTQSQLSPADDENLPIHNIHQLRSVASSADAASWAGKMHHRSWVTKDDLQPVNSVVATSTHTTTVHAFHGQMDRRTPDPRYGFTLYALGMTSPPPQPLWGQRLSPTFMTWNLGSPVN